ncbi:fucolectin-1 [Microcaecilia unicolor]|uniref:Fucolectin-1-like n=1 Tax=Microcaecilia unicolor TaxID=1415580 RepID=A0A6P7WSE0_9AMPH|nr:fucolectin-1-like [Microcaecilia unicolor]
MDKYTGLAASAITQTRSCSRGTCLHLSPVQVSSHSVLIKMRFHLILLFGIGVFEGIQADLDCNQNGDNIALTGVATQSSVKFNGSPGRAINGDQNGNYHENSCSHTSPEKSPWWQLDLQKSWKIETIVVANRKDCCPERLIGAEIRVGNSPDLDNPLCGTITDISQGPLIKLCCNGMEGRYVRVVIPDRTEMLTLCEVEVYPVTEKENDDACW